MGRLIDADEFSRKIQEDFHGCCSEIQLAPYQVDKMLDNQPTVDAVPVVRCKNCIDYNPKLGCMNCLHPMYSDDFYNHMEDDDFCSYGKRKDEQN